MTVWNQIINAVYRDEWKLVDDQLGAATDHDNAVDVASRLGFICGERLRKGNGDQLPEVVTWLLRQPTLHRETFAEWVACDALKGDSPMHRALLKRVEDVCRADKLQDNMQRLLECKHQTNRARETAGWHSPDARLCPLVFRSMN